MTVPLRAALVLFGLMIMVSSVRAQTRPGSAEPLLGRHHLWLKCGQVDLDDAAGAVWGVNRARYIALEGYVGTDRVFYGGGEIGRAGAGEATTSAGETIRDFDLLWLEVNGKKVFNLHHRLSVDLGLGGTLFYAEGKEVSTSGGQELSSPLADLGFGAQAFVDLNWRLRHMLIGPDAKYHWAFDIFGVSYSNLRLGAHLGIAF